MAPTMRPANKPTAIPIGPATEPEEIPIPTAVAIPAPAPAPAPSPIAAALVFFSSYSVILEERIPELSNCLSNLALV
jgi:hypothetical protein